MCGDEWFKLRRRRVEALGARVGGAPTHFRCVGVNKQIEGHITPVGIEGWEAPRRATSNVW